MYIEKIIWKAVLLGAFIGLVVSSPAHAQTATGEISGAVSDPTGAAIPKASITLTSEDTKVSRTTVANQDGHYIFTNVLTGSYNVSVEASGFNKTEEANITVQVNQIVALNYTLTIGNVEEKVEVTASAQALQTSSSALGTVIDSNAVNDLPLNGHNFTQLLTLTPGVTPVQNEQGAGSGFCAGRAAQRRHGNLPGAGYDERFCVGLSEHGGRGDRGAEHEAGRGVVARCTGEIPQRSKGAGFRGAV